MLLPLSLLAAFVATDTVPIARPLEVESVQATAAFVVHRQPAIPLVSLRLAILADDSPGYAGTGHLLQHLVFPVLREQAARVGGTAQMQRSADAMVYTVTGPTAELAFLAELLRNTLQPPTATEGDVRLASRQLAEERLAEWETAEQHIRAAIRVRLFPNDLSAAGTESSASRLTAALLPSLWAEMYRPERISLTAVGDVAIADVQAAFGTVPPRLFNRAAPLRRDTTNLAPLASAQATRAWLGTGYLASDISPAELSIAARVIREDLRRRLPTAQVESEHWWSHYGQALVLVLSVPDTSQVAAARRALSTAVTTVQTNLQARQVEAAARALRHEMLFYARTPERMAEVLGRFTDRDGSGASAQAFYAELEEVDVAGVRAALAALSRTTPVRREIPPQLLTPRVRL